MERIETFQQKFDQSSMNQENSIYIQCALHLYRGRSCN